VGSQAKKLRRTGGRAILRDVKEGLSELSGVQGKIGDFVEAAQRMEELFARLDGAERLDEVLDAVPLLKEVKESLGQIKECLDTVGTEQRRQRWVSLQLLYLSFSRPDVVIDLDRLAQAEDYLRSDFDRAEADAK
jgi:hypothetical protein